MGGGLLQLVAYGAQDVYLSGNPEITFFKFVHRRYTNFAIEHIEQTNLGTVAFGNRFSVTVSRNGDLIGNVILEVDMPALDTLAAAKKAGSAEDTDGLTVDGAGDTAKFGYVPYLGNRLIEDVTIEIGGQKIHGNDYIYSWSADQLEEGDDEGYKKMIGADGSVFNANGGTLYIPLKFWFTKHYGNSLPLIALQYHEVKINVTLASFSDLVSGNTGGTVAAKGTPSCRCFVDYIFLDQNERHRFAKHTHEYLIEEVQSSGSDTFAGCKARHSLQFNHPVKYLMWLVHDNSCGTDKHTWHEFTAAQTCGLQLNNQDRFAERKGGYFTMVQPWQHWSNIPENTNVHVYSFAIHPEELQPSGTCNFSRIDSVMLHLTMSEEASDSSYITHVYARSYNVLRVMSGMGGKAFSS